MHTKTHRKTSPLSENAFAKKALEEIERIEKDAQQKKLAQIESLQSAKAAILERLNELNHQLSQIDDAIAKITGKPVPTRTTERKPRRNLDEVRERLARWMEGRKGQKFMAADLVREFPELEDVQVSLFLKPLMESGKVKTDASEGNRRMKYYVDG